jgi:hypothetical protein
MVEVMQQINEKESLRESLESRARDLKEGLLARSKRTEAASEQAELKSDSMQQHGAAIDVTKAHTKSHNPLERALRSGVKTVIYRAGSLATVTPATALTTYYMAHGNIELSTALAAITAGVALSNIVYNSTYYYCYERLATRFHWGYKEKEQTEERKSHKPWEASLRSLVKTATYRAGSLATATPATAITTYYMAHGNVEWGPAFTAILAGIAFSNIVYNSTYYYLAERVATRFHWGYKFRRGEEEKKTMKSDTQTS